MHDGQIKRIVISDDVEIGMIVREMHDDATVPPFADSVMLKRMKIRFEVSPACLDRIRVHVEGQFNLLRFQWTTDFDPNLAMGGLLFHIKDQLQIQMPELVKKHPDEEERLLCLCRKIARGIVDFGALPETQARMEKDWKEAITGSSKAVAWVRKQLEHDVKNIVKTGIRRQDALLAFEQVLDEQLVKAVHDA